ncbi:Uma2 family endonuclease [Lyngbya sp. CCY1209]|uniref:Uma2 family endonuclease n=1 Tax=Lyngbya sp. CCY1209 TaxID=2886103 RepID=UPI002D210F4E|nr:Uma2 family endonuclease [Lyngbya sp. CCY1209]MEB3882214.1 Uma2 family endonuclease [Lyngbya sp. CCY1209]
MTLSLEKPTPPNSILQRHDATWQDYVAIRDNQAIDWRKISFHKGWLWIDMGKEGPNHASFSDLMTMIFGFWVFLHPECVLQSYRRCIIERPDTHACAPDLVLYKGDNIPRWQPGEPRRIDLRRHRLPDLVGEIADTTLSLDLDEQKQLYASLNIPEYWVVDVKGLRIFAFALAESGRYESIEESQVLTGLPITLLEQTLERLTTETNTAAASWLIQQLQNLPERKDGTAESEPEEEKNVQ